MITVLTLLAACLVGGIVGGISGTLLNNLPKRRRTALPPATVRQLRRAQRATRLEIRERQPQRWFDDEETR